MADVAAAAGVSVGTVSRVLRSHPRISAGTQERVRQVVAELGYVPNPLVGALMSWRRRRDVPGAFAVAVVVPKPVSVLPAARTMLSGVEARLAEAGCGVATMEIEADGSDSAAAGRKIRARGIPGVLLMPARSPREKLTLPWDGIACVSAGTRRVAPPMDAVVGDDHALVNAALEHARERGFRRPAVLLHAAADRLLESRQLAGALSWRWMHGGDTAPPLIDDGASIEPTLAWIREHRPDVVVAGSRWHRLACAARLRADECPRWISLGSEEGGIIARVYVDPVEVGRAAVDLLLARVRAWQVGLPAAPRTLLVPPVVEVAGSGEGR